jgi:hypothetical protein
MRGSTYFLAVLLFVFPAVFFLPDYQVRAQDEGKDLLPTANLYKPDEIREGFDRQEITPFDDPKFSFEVPIPKDWDSRRIETSEKERKEAEAGEAMARMAVFSSKSHDEKNVTIEIYFMRVPTRVQLSDWMDTAIANTDSRVLARQAGEYIGREVEDVLLAREGDVPLFTRFTASRRGEYIFVVSGTSPKDQYPKYSRIFGLAALAFHPLGSEHTP